MNYKIVSGSTLKMIAIISMAIDHIAHFLLRNSDWFIMPLFTFHSFKFSWYLLFRAIGRLSFPIFAFLVVEGFLHTSDRWKYGKNLFIFALLSEIPWALLHNGFHLIGHNVMFTLLLGFLGLCTIDYYQTDRKKMGIILLSMLCFAYIFRSDYNGLGFTFIILLYVLRHNRIIQFLIGSSILPMKLMASLSFIPINMYNGKRGFIKGNIAKYLFYAFYPLHLLSLYLLRNYFYY